jgi:hypothetical protein
MVDGGLGIIRDGRGWWRRRRGGALGCWCVEDRLGKGKVWAGDGAGLG